MQQSATHDEDVLILPRMMQRAIAWFRGHTATAHRMRHIETLPLGPKRSLFLVECDGRKFLVAAAGDSVSAPVLLEADQCGFERTAALQRDDS